MKIVRIAYHHEAEGWWAESKELPGWTAIGETFDTVRAMAREGAAEFADGAVLIEEDVPRQFPTAGVWTVVGRRVVTSLQGGSTIQFSMNVVPQTEPRQSGISGGTLEPDHDLSLLAQEVRSR